MEDHTIKCGGSLKMPENIKITEVFMKAGRKIRRSEFFGDIVRALLFFAAALLVFSLVERFVPFQEKSSFMISIACLAILMISAAYLAFGLRLGKIDPVRLALEIEKKHPELMDSLVCAVEKESIPPDQRRVLERELIKSVSDGKILLEIEKDLLRRDRLKFRLVAMTGIILALFVVSGSRFFTKSANYFQNIAGISGSGIRVIPGNADVEEGSDLKIKACIERWENEAEIVYSDSKGEHRFSMAPGKNRIPEFTLYELSENIRYRVRTPSLVSDQYKIQIYSPPSIEKSQMKIFPPAYTGKKGQSFDSIQDISVPCGTRLVVKIKTANAPKVFLETGGKKEAFGTSPDPDFNYLAEIEIEKSLECKIVLEDPAGRTKQSHVFKIESVPDQPPVVDLIDPQDDVKAAPGDKVRFSASASDDYGVSAMAFNLSVSGGENNVVQKQVEAVEPEKARLRMDYEYDMDLSKIKAVAGDVICCFFTAQDNRSPDANTSRSKIIFVEVREKSEPKDVEGSGEMDIFRFIAELKRLIRLTYDVISAPPEEKKYAGGELSDFLSKLRTELSSELARLTGKQAGDDEIKNMDVIRELAQAEDFARSGLYKESLPNQMRALALLTALSQKLMNNRPKDSKSGKGQSEEQNKEQKSGKGETSLKELMEKLNEMLAGLGTAAGKQNALNSSMDSIPGKNPDRKETAELSGKQKELEKDLRALAGKIPTGINMKNLEDEMNSSASSMQKSSGSLAENNPGQASRDGHDAHYSLLSSMEIIRQTMRKITAAQIEAVATGAEKLAGMQKQEAGKSSKSASDPDSAKNGGLAKKMRDSQNQLSDMDKELANMADELSSSLMDEYPEVANQMQKAASETPGIQSSMKKASNSLLYAKFAKASEFQNSAAQGLAKFAESVRQSKKFLPKMSPEEIMALLGKINDSAERLQREKQSSGPKTENASRISGNIGRNISTAGNETEDMELSGTGKALEKMDFKGNPDASYGKAAELLANAEYMLRKHLAMLELKKKVELRKKSSSPPEKYRGMVEEYFKSLSR